MALQFFRAADHTGVRGISAGLESSDVGELFVFIGEFALFQAAVNGGALDAGGEMAPVSPRGERTGHCAGTRRGEMGVFAGDEEIAHGEYVGESGARTGLDDARAQVWQPTRRARSSVIDLTAGASSLRV